MNSRKKREVASGSKSVTLEFWDVFAAEKGSAVS